MSYYGGHEPKRDDGFGWFILSVFIACIVGACIGLLIGLIGGRI